VRNTARGGHEAPDENAGGDDQPPAVAVRQAPDGNAEKRVEEREREPDQQAHLRVGDAEVLADRPYHQRENLPVDE
jgi:hypothetical protein